MLMKIIKRGALLIAKNFIADEKMAEKLYQQAYYVAAFKMFKKHAKNTECQFRLGNMCERGQGVLQNDQEAARW